MTFQNVYKVGWSLAAYPNLFATSGPIARFYRAPVTLYRDFQDVAAPDTGVSDQCMTFAHRIGISLGIRACHKLRCLLPNSVALHLPCEVAWIIWVPSAHQLHRLPAQNVFSQVVTRAFLGVGHTEFVDCPAQPGRRQPFSKHTMHLCDRDSQPIAGKRVSPVRELAVPE